MIDGFNMWCRVLSRGLVVSFPRILQLVGRRASNVENRAMRLNARAGTIILYVIGRKFARERERLVFSLSRVNYIPSGYLGTLASPRHLPTFELFHFRSVRAIAWETSIFPARDRRKSVGIDATSYVSTTTGCYRENSIEAAGALERLNIPWM